MKMQAGKNGERADCKFAALRIISESKNAVNGFRFFKNLFLGLYLTPALS